MTTKEIPVAEFMRKYMPKEETMQTMKKFTLVWREIAAGESKVECMSPDEARILAARNLDEDYDTYDSSVHFELMRVEDEDGEIVWENEEESHE
jgi:hypothetical protein